MPTTLERTTVTHTAPVQSMLRTAAQAWPDAGSDRELILRLMSEGAASLREKELEDAYVAAYAEWAASDDAPLWESAAGDGVGAHE